MDVSAGCCVLGVATVIMFIVWRVSNLSWFVSTKKLRKHIRDQGLNDSSNKCMSREGKEMAQTKTEAKSKQFSLTRDMAPRVSPFFYRSINTHEFHVGDKVMLKASSWKGIVRFEKDGKFSPHFLGPFTVLERVGSQAYKLDLPHEMHEIHDTINVAYLYPCKLEQQNVNSLSDVQIGKKTMCIGEPKANLDTLIKRLRSKQNLHNVIPLSNAQIDNKKRYVEEPVEEPEAILDTKLMSLRNKQILLVKVQWRHRHGVNVTWEPKEEIQKRYPKLFV
ncbi:hypothetical protein Lser_V15G40733 [Lactuca serriola]